MKIIIQVGEASPAVLELKAEFEKNNFLFVPSTNPDEILQLSLQQKGAPLVFSDFKFCLKYLSENNLSQLNHTLVLYVKAKPVINEKIEEVLRKTGLKIYYPQIKEELLLYLRDFFSGTVVVEDLKFTEE